jgi:hypothetical protein
MATNRTLVPIYTSKGDTGAFMAYPYLFNLLGEWIGWVTPDRQVYSVQGYYVGWLTNDPRILRKRSTGFDQRRRSPPVPPPRVTLPAQVALAPLMAELSYSDLDVLEDSPDLLPPVDAGELRQDLE